MTQGFRASPGNDCEDYTPPYKSCPGKEKKPDCRHRITQLLGPRLLTPGDQRGARPIRCLARRAVFEAKTPQVSKEGRVTGAEG